MTAIHFLIHLALLNAIEHNLKQSLVGDKTGSFEMKTYPIVIEVY